MSNFIMGYLFGSIFNYDNLMRIGKRNVDSMKIEVVPKFLCRWIDDENIFDDNDDWYEKEFRIRYVNVTKNEEGYEISLSWEEKMDSEESIRCENQKLAKLAADIIRPYYSTLGKITEYIGDNLVISSFIKDIITIHIGKEEKQGADETIYCYDIDEAEEIAERMRNFYCVYREVRVENEL